MEGVAGLAYMYIRIYGNIMIFIRHFTLTSGMLVWASTDSSYLGIFGLFYVCLSSLDVAALYKDSHARVKRFV